MKNIKYLLIVLAFWGCSSIGFYKSPEAKYQEIAGRTFQYPKKDVFNACLNSLKASGWTVTSSDLETGAISGTRDASSEADVDRQTATVSVVEGKAGQTEVRITAGLQSPNPGGKAASDAPAVKKMPKMCEPFLNSVQETLLKVPQNGAN
jgi:hypothetical protein